jgi:hypothetical protein
VTVKFSEGRTAVVEPGPGLNGSVAVGAQVPSARLPLRTRQRKPGYIALAVALVVGLAALGGYFYTVAGSKTPVVVVVNEIPAGHVVSREDLSTVDVAGGVTAVGAGNISSVVGLTATVTLLPDTLLQRSMVTEGPLLDAGEAQVGVEVVGGQLPAGGLAAGDTVLVLQLPDKSATNAAGAQAEARTLVEKATVFATAPDPSDASGTLVTLVAPAAAAPAIATASNFGVVALVKVAP